MRVKRYFFPTLFLFLFLFRICKSAMAIAVMGLRSDKGEHSPSVQKALQLQYHMALPAIFPLPLTSFTRFVTIPQSACALGPCNFSWHFQFPTPATSGMGWDREDRPERFEDTDQVGRDLRVAVLKERPCAQEHITQPPKQHRSRVKEGYQFTFDLPLSLPPPRNF